LVAETIESIAMVNEAIENPDGIVLHTDGVSQQPAEWKDSRAIHLEKITKPTMVKVVKRTVATSRPLTGRWVDVMSDDGVMKSRWTTRGFEQKLEGDENFYSGTPALGHLKVLLTLAEIQGHVAAIGDCGGAFYMSPLDEEVFMEAPEEAGLAWDECWQAICAFPGLKGAPRAWQRHSTKVLVEELGMEQSHYDDCCFWEHGYGTDDERQKSVKAGRHIDDFLITGPQAKVDLILEKLGTHLNLRDIVRLYKQGDNGILLSMHITKVKGGYTLAGKASLIDDMSECLGLENANPVKTPEQADRHEQQGDRESLSTQDHGTYRTVVGKAIHVGHHRPDIQHAVHGVSRHVASPTAGDMKDLKRLVRYLLGTRNVLLLLIPNKDAVPFECYVDSDWADNKNDRKSCSGGALKIYGTTVMTWSRAQAAYALSSTEAELYALAVGAVECLGLQTLMREWGYSTVPHLHTDSQAAKAVCMKRGPGRMKHVELRLLVIQDWVEQGRLKLFKVGTHVNPADMMTKGINFDKLVRFARMLGLRGDTFNDPTHDAPHED
jgi:hypothetical protein